MKKVVLATACLLFSISIYAQTIMGRQVVDQYPKNSIGTLTYGLTWLPTTYANTTRSYPLIISLHGAGETGTSIADLAKLYNSSPRAVAGRIADGWNAVAVNPLTGVQDSFIVVSPQAASWSYSYSDFKYILPALLNKYRIDRSRIYLVGLSAGGGGTVSTFGSRDAAFIQNFAAMATASSAGTNASNGYTSVEVEAGLRYGSTYGVRMWTIAGEADYLLNTDMRYHDSTNMLNPSPANKYTVIQGVGHSAWGRAYDPNFRPTINYYGKTGTCNNGCAFGGVPVAPNSNGSTVRGSGKTQDSLNLYEWLLLAQRPLSGFSANIGDYRSNAPKPTGGKWSNTASWRRFDGTNWVTTTVLPNASTGTITIRANDSIDVDIAVSNDQLQIESAGVLNVQTASLTITDGPGTDLLVNGTINLHNAQSISGAGTNELNGVLNWYGGTLSLNTISSTGSSTHLSTNTNKTLGANFTNNGTFNWATGVLNGNIILNNASFINNGLVNELFSSNKGFVNGGGTVAITNNGIFKKLSLQTFLNNGIVFTNTGTLQGIGSINFSPGTIINNGIIKPGNSPGILNISEGALTGQNSTINIDIFDNSGPGTGHNQLDLTGNISLTGNSLNVTELSDLPSQFFVILTTTGSFSGTFASTSLPVGYAIIYNSNEVIVSKSMDVLPAVWGIFEVNAVENSADLKWTTLQEENTSHFDVEHSVDGVTFQKIGTVQAQGNSHLPVHYRFKHHSPSFTATNYYRLRLIDLKGTVSTSLVRNLKLEKQKAAKVSLLTNRVSNNLQLIVHDNNIQARIIDMSGKVYANKAIQKGSHSFYTGNYSSGIYKLILQQGATLIQTETFIVQ